MESLLTEIDHVAIAVNDLEAAGYKINPQTSGGFNDRFIAGTKTPSQHAYGLAVDVNWDKNPRGGAAEEIPADLANKLATKWGLTWGGNWAGASRDPMHFEVAQKAPESAPPQQGGVQLASATGTDTGDHAPPGPAPGGTQPAAASQPQPAAPPSPGTPTHQAGGFGIEYQMVQKAWDDAQKAFPGREDLQRKAVASIWERVQQANILQQKFEGEQAKAQRDAEEKAGQDVVTALSADAAASAWGSVPSAAASASPSSPSSPSSRAPRNDSAAAWSRSTPSPSSTSAPCANTITMRRRPSRRKSSSSRAGAISTCTRCQPGRGR